MRLQPGLGHPEPLHQAEQVGDGHAVAVAGGAAVGGVDVRVGVDPNESALLLERDLKKISPQNNAEKSHLHFSTDAWGNTLLPQSSRNSKLSKCKSWISCYVALTFVC